MHLRHIGMVSLAVGLHCAGCGDSSSGRDSEGGDGVGGAPTSTDGGSGPVAEGGDSAGTTPVSEPKAVCEAPAPWELPTTSQVVGDGTMASCTEVALRTAVEAGGHVTFNCGSAEVAIEVTTALSVTKPTVVDGGGIVTLDGGGQARIFDVGSNQSLSVRNLTFINGRAADSMEPDGIGGAVAGEWRSRVEVIGCHFENNTAGRGGGAVAVWTDSSLVVIDSTFVGNVSWYGGAAYSLLSPLTIVNSVFTDNETVTDGGLGDGGAIGTDGASASPDDSLGGEVLICGTRIAGSQGYGSGGGAYIWVYPPDRVTIDRTTVEENRLDLNADDGAALGAAMRISNGEIFVKDSSFLSNTTATSGGALYLDCEPTCKITNSTFYGNRAEAYGGAIFGDRHELNNVTFVKNYAGGHGGALFGSDFVVNNSLFLDNEAGNPWGQAMSCSSTGTGDRVLQWLSASQNAGSDSCIAEIIAADPKLGELGDNGGETRTLLPASGSAALDAGADCEPRDQRGMERDSARCDLGAVEVP